MTDKISPWYACKKCRTKLFQEKNVDSHLPGTGQDMFSWTKRTKTADIKCSSLFISEAMEWMGDVSDPEGKLDCPKCKGRVGSFTWHGAQCSCGYWCTPAFQALQSRLDKVHKQPDFAIRQPKVMIEIIKEKEEEVVAVAEESIVNDAELLDFL